MANGIGWNPIEGKLSRRVGTCTIRHFRRVGTDALLRLTCKEDINRGLESLTRLHLFQCTCRPMAGRQPSKLVMRVRLPPGAPSFNLSVGESGTPPALGAGGRRFKSCRTDQHGCVAQSAEHGPLKPGVVGSIPTAPTMSRNFLMLPLVEFGEDATL